MTVRTLLEERQKTHGEFSPKAWFTQSLKDAFRAAPNWSDMTPAQREALDMICLKLGRIAHGDPLHADNWEDLAGYAILGSKS